MSSRTADAALISARTRNLAFTTMGNMSSNAAVRKPKQVSELGRARALGLLGAVKGGPRDVAERHSQHLRRKLRRRLRRTG